MLCDYLNKITGSDDPPLYLQIRQSINDSNLICLFVWVLLKFNQMMKWFLCLNKPDVPADGLGNESNGLYSFLRFSTDDLQPSILEFFVLNLILADLTTFS